MLAPLKSGTAKGEGMGERGGTCPPPAFFVPNKRLDISNALLVLLFGSEL